MARILVRLLALLSLLLEEEDLRQCQTGHLLNSHSCSCSVRPNAQVEPCCSAGYCRADSLLRVQDHLTEKIFENLKESASI